jgi:DNA-binding response OmpR family regulator
MSETPASGSHLLVVDDDVDVVELARRYFSQHGFRVTGASDGRAMRRALAEHDVDLVLLDLGLPGEDGLDLTRYLRENWRGPVIIVSGRGDSVDRVVGLELGADDYVSKPFDLRELLARVRSVLRRSGDRAPPAADAATARVRFAGFLLDHAARKLTAEDGTSVPLTTGEYDLLQVFLERPNRVLSRDDLIARMHGRDAGPFDRSVDMQVGRLRRKIEADPTRPELIKSVRGAGYLFAVRPQPA